MKNIDSILENLNERQRKAVTTTEGYVRVIAGAGSGKTKALISRYAYLIEALGINDANILCVTFTNKAAGEMRTRIRRMLGNNDFGYITTYDGFCVKILREDIHKIGYPKQFVIMDVEDQKAILRDIYEEYGFNAKDFTFKELLSYIGKNKDITNYVEYIDEGADIKRKGVALKDSASPKDKIFLRYIEKQMRNFALDFDDLMYFTLYIFGKHGEVLKKWQQRLHYIQVDEMQDTSELQYKFINLLAHYHMNLFVVGDPDQAIYEWRDAKPEILVSFDVTHSGTETVIMNQNYRSTPNILKLGNDVIKHNKLRVPKDLFTNKQAGAEVIHYHAKNDFDEGLFVASEIKRIVEKENGKYTDFAILYRAHHASRIIEQTLIQNNIPYVIWGGIRFFERKEIKDILSYLRLIVYGDDISFLRVINKPSRKLGKTFISQLKQIAEQNNLSLFETLETNTFNRTSTASFVALIRSLRQRKNEISVSDFVNEILMKTGLMEVYRLDGEEERMNNIKELQNSIIALESDEAETITLDNYLQEIALFTTMDMDNKSNERVKLMTIHTAKGLEFPYVFLCQFSDGILPNHRSLSQGRDRALEEERRLAYVAITRAEKGFYMTESEGFNYQTGLNKVPSRFLLSIKENLYVRNGILPQEIIDEARRRIESIEPSPEQVGLYNINDKVIHPVFGEGTVVEIDEYNRIYMIRFEGIDKIKPIRFEWAGLEKLIKI